MKCKLRLVPGLILLFGLTLFGNAQTLWNGGHIPTTYQTNWTRAGLLPSTPTISTQVIDVNTARTGSEPWEAVVQTLVNNASAAPAGTVTMLYFPQTGGDSNNGIYTFTGSITVSPGIETSIIFQGDGAERTYLYFDNGNKVAFHVKGNPTHSTLPADADLDIILSKRSNGFFVDDATDFEALDWIILEQEGFYNHWDCEGCGSWIHVGQIDQITGINQATNNMTIWTLAAKTYTPNETTSSGDVKTTITKFEPVQNIGFENFTLHRVDEGQAPESKDNNITFEYAVNCWVKGVHMRRTPRHHIKIDWGAHIEVSGCYFVNANSKKNWGGGFGYGVIIQNASTNNLIQNNIFRKLRHSILLQAGANTNVITYNFSRQPEKCENHDNRTFNQCIPIPGGGGEIVLHSNYSYSNLFEHNVANKIEADNANSKEDGPYNAFVRNIVRDGDDVVPPYTDFFDLGTHLKFREIPLVSNLGNWLRGGIHYIGDKTTIGIDLYGYETNSGAYPTGDAIPHLTGIVLDQSLQLQDVSYYYDSAPDFLEGMSWPSAGPRLSLADPMPDQNIPAANRYHHHTEKTYNNSSTEHNAIVKTSVVNSFPGGVVEVDEQVVATGIPYTWNIGETHVLEAIDQVWPQTGGFNQKFEGWLDTGNNLVSTNKEYTFQVKAVPGSYTAMFSTLYDIDVSMDFLNGGSGGVLTIDGLPQATPYSAQTYIKDVLVVGAAPVTKTINGIPVEYKLRSWTNDSFEEVQTLTPDDHVNLTAYMKGQRMANSAEATHGSQQSKLISNPITDELHMVYEDDGAIYYTFSSDYGITWSRDMMIDGSDDYGCLNPSISIDKYETIHIFYERKDASEYDVCYMSYDFDGNASAIEILGSSATTYGGNGRETTPAGVAEYNGKVFVVWRFSGPLGLKGLVLREKDVLSGWGPHRVVPGTGAHSYQPTVSYGLVAGNDYPTHVFWCEGATSTQINQLSGGYSNSQWEWNLPTTDLTPGNTFGYSGFPSVHQIYESNPKDIFLTWQALQPTPPNSSKTANIRQASNKRIVNEGEIVIEDKKSVGRKGSSTNCPVPVPADPIVCFREHKGSWLPTIVFETNNWCDRKPVVTSWQYATDQNVMIAFESDEGEISTVERDHVGVWHTVTVLTTNGSNPSITALDEVEPNLIYTKHSSNPHEIVFEGDITQYQGKTATVIPHRRRVSLNMEQAIHNASLSSFDGDVIIEIGDLEIQTADGIKFIKPQHSDSALTAENAFIFNKIELDESMRIIRVPVRISARNVVAKSGIKQKGVSIPLLSLGALDAVSNKTIGSMKEYDSAFISIGDTAQVIDTLEFDLKAIKSSAIVIQGTMHLRDKPSGINFYEVYNLRNLKYDSAGNENAAEIISNQLPKTFALRQNFPNPFNPTTTIRFDLPKNSTVSLKIYDVQGRLVRKLVNQKMKAGFHETQWDGLNSHGNRVATGVYFYRIRADKFIRTKKMVLVR
ncbi:MAG: FlgD immunoglobulin-like domain containing protein [Calditrichia bacterium]